MDYDTTNVPSTYDAGRELSATEKREALRSFAAGISNANIAEIVDLGCGTGRFSEALADTFDANVTGVEPSAKMIAQAHAKYSDERLSFRSGSGEAIPLDAQTSDMIFMSMILHHLQNLQQVAEECARILRSGGVVCIRNTVTEEIPSYPYLTFFPSIGEIIRSKLISRVRLGEVFNGAGFSLATHRSQWDQISPSWEKFADKISLRADSFTAQLPDDEFADGLNAIRIHSQSASPSERVGLNVDQFVFRNT